MSLDEVGQEGSQHHLVSRTSMLSSSMLNINPRQQLLQARDILELGLKNVSYARQAVALSDGKSIADISWAKVGAALTCRHYPLLTWCQNIHFRDIALFCNIWKWGGGDNQKVRSMGKRQNSIWGKKGKYENKRKIKGGGQYLTLFPSISAKWGKN